MYINGSLVATAQLGAVTDSDGDGLTDRFEEGAIRYSRIEWGKKYSWTDARTHATGWGRYRGLATVTSEAERTAVLSLFSSTSDLLWLGGTDEVAEGSWKWISGETWGFVPSGSTLSSGTADLDYLRMQGSGAWTSQASSQTNAYLLEAGYRTSASNPDTDGDGISDLDEYLQGSSPVDNVGAVTMLPPVITNQPVGLTTNTGANVSFSVAALNPGPNMLSNSSFESGLTNWTTYGGTISTTNLAFSGSTAAVLNKDISGGYGRLRYATDFTWPAGSPYLISSKIYGNYSEGYDLMTYGSGYTGEYNIVNLGTRRPESNTNWVEYRWVLSAKANTTRSLNLLDIAGTYVVDDFELRACSTNGLSSVIEFLLHEIRKTFQIIILNSCWLSST